MKFVVRTTGRFWGIYDNPKGTLSDPFKNHSSASIEITDQSGTRWMMLKSSVVAWKEFNK